jgi:hypothetical protein
MCLVLGLRRDGILITRAARAEPGDIAVALCAHAWREASANGDLDGG